MGCSGLPLKLNYVFLCTNVYGVILQCISFNILAKFHGGKKLIILIETLRTTLSCKQYTVKINSSYK